MSKCGECRRELYSYIKINKKEAERIYICLKKGCRQIVKKTKVKPITASKTNYNDALDKMDKIVTEDQNALKANFIDKLNQKTKKNMKEYPELKKNMYESISNKEMYHIVNTLIY